MYYVDDNGNIINMQTPLTDALSVIIEDYYEKLSNLTAEQRMNYFKYGQYVQPLRYTQDVDNTTYVVRTHFDENESKTILQKIEKMAEKDMI